MNQTELYQAIRQLLGDYENLLESMEYKWDSYPAGTLTPLRQRGGYQYYCNQVKEQGRRLQIPIPTNTRYGAQLLDELKEKRTVHHARPVLRRNIRALQKALADWTPYDPEELSGLYDIHNAGSRHGVKLNTDRGSEMNAGREFPGIAGRESSAGLHFGHESAGTGRPAPAEVTNHGTGTYNDEFTFPTADDDFSLPPLPDSVFLPGQLNVRKWIDDTRAGNYRTNPYYPERLRFTAETAESPLSRRQIRTVLQTAVLSGSI